MLVYCAMTRWVLSIRVTRDVKTVVHSWQKVPFVSSEALQSVTIL